jgi:peptidyl-prolyl cis-trans isomerase D
VQEPIVGGNIVARTSVERYLGLLDQQREAAATAIDADAYLKEVKIDDAAVKAFYDANPAAFQVPEEVKLEYVTLSPETLGAQIALDPAEVRKQYDDVLGFMARLRNGRRHILITVKPMRPGTRDSAKRTPRISRRRRRKNRRNSVSWRRSCRRIRLGSGRGPGFFARDSSMVKPFQDAVFSLKTGDLRPGATDFGWRDQAHRDPAGKAAEASVKSGRRSSRTSSDEATRKFAEAADQLQNLVYGRADSLQPVAGRST